MRVYLCAMKTFFTAIAFTFALLSCTGDPLETQLPEREEQEQAGGQGKEENNEPSDQTMTIQVTDGTNTVTFMLNDTPAAKDLYAQVPFTTDVDNYCNNEKIFYPAKSLTKTGNTEGDCPAGTIAYFSPWGNVVMYYGNAPRYSGLFLLGTASEGKENIAKLSGKITVTK